MQGTGAEVKLLSDVAYLQALRQELQALELAFRKLAKRTGNFLTQATNGNFGRIERPQPAAVVLAIHANRQQGLWLAQRGDLRVHPLCVFLRLLREICPN